MPKRIQEHFNDIANGRDDLAWCEVMRYIGLQDKNGKEIYEGDIVRCMGGFEFDGLREYDITGTIEFSRSASFDVVTKDKTYYSFAYADFDTFEIIGNIYENKNLINK